MAFSFDPYLVTERDEFRSRLDDVSANGAYFQDETIDALILKWGLLRAELSGVNTIILRLGKKVSALTSASGARFAWTERVRVYRELKEELLAEAGLEEWYEGEDPDGPGNVTTLNFRPEDEEYLEIYSYEPGAPVRNGDFGRSFGYEFSGEGEGRGGRRR